MLLSLLVALLALAWSAWTAYLIVAVRFNAGLARRWKALWNESEERAAEALDLARRAIERREEIVKGRSAEEPSGTAPVEDPRIAALRLVRDDYDGYGSPGPSALAVDLSSKFLDACKALDLVPTKVVGSAPGAVFLRFGDERRYAHVEIFNNGDILAASRFDGFEPAVWRVDLLRLDECVQRIRRLGLRSPVHANETPGGWAMNHERDYLCTVVVWRDDDGYCEARVADDARQGGLMAWGHSVEEVLADLGSSLGPKEPR